VVDISTDVIIPTVNLTMCFNTGHRTHTKQD